MPSFDPSLIPGIGLLLANRLLQRVGLRKRGDGWRRGAGLVLRGEAATFVLSAFSLDVWSDVGDPGSFDLQSTQDHFSSRLSSFLQAEKPLHICIARTDVLDSVAPCDGPSYTLGFKPWIDAPTRFIRPSRWDGVDCRQTRVRSSDVLMNIVCRLSPDGTADVWVRFNHIGIDGVAAQEMLLRLERALGQRSAVVYPTHNAFSSHQAPRECLGRSELVEVQTFIDFTPLMTWRKKVSATLPKPITVAAALQWALARQPEFGKLTMGSTVDVPAVDGLARGVGVVVIRPADYFVRGDGLLHFVQDFNRSVDLARRRQSEEFKALDAAARIPPKLANKLLRHALSDEKAFGSLAFSVIKDAKVFGAPMGDAGHPDGFIALGGVGLDAGNGKTVGCVTIKGPPKVAEYPRLIQSAIAEL